MSVVLHKPIVSCHIECDGRIGAMPPVKCGEKTDGRNSIEHAEFTARNMGWKKIGMKWFCQNCARDNA